MSLAGTGSGQQARGQRADALEQRIGELSSALERMCELLAGERAALRERTSADALERVASDKQAAVETIAALYRGLRQALDAFGEAGTDPSHALEQLRGVRPDLAARADRLVVLTRECQQANQENGLMVSAGLRSANHALDSLHGVTPTSNPTYGPGGRTARPQGAGFVTLRA